MPCLRWGREPRAGFVEHPGPPSCFDGDGVNTPWRAHLCGAYDRAMKHKHDTRNQTQKPAGAARSAAAVEFRPNEVDFVASPDEVARRAYFIYLNQGSFPGQDVQNWLAAEAELIAECNTSRVHGY